MKKNNDSQTKANRCGRTRTAAALRHGPCRRGACPAWPPPATREVSSSRAWPPPAAGRGYPHASPAAGNPVLLVAWGRGCPRARRPPWGRGCPRARRPPPRRGCPRAPPATGEVSSSLCATAAGRGCARAARRRGARPRHGAPARARPRRAAAVACPRPLWLPHAALPTER
ncbi:unnamed protein product [Urochloa humidicola]